MMFVNLRFSGRAILPNTMVWVPDRSRLSFRLTEAPISMPWLAPEGKTLITFDIGCEVGDARWTMSDEDLARTCLDQICALTAKSFAGGISAPAARSAPDLLSRLSRRLRDRAPPLLHVDRRRRPLQRGTQRRIRPHLMEDVFWRTIRRMEDVARYVAAPADGAQPALSLEERLAGLGSRLPDCPSRPDTHGRSASGKGLLTRCAIMALRRVQRVIFGKVLVRPATRLRRAEAVPHVRSHPPCPARPFSPRSPLPFSPPFRRSARCMPSRRPPPRRRRWPHLPPPPRKARMPRCSASCRCPASSR